MVVQKEVLPFYETGDITLDRYQRIETIGETEGFLPVSKPEQVEAMGLASVISKSYGASRHLAEVAQKRGKQNIPDVERAGRKIIRNYIDWALDAKKTTAELNTLAEEIADVNPELRLDEPDLAHDIGVSGLLKFLRFYDLSMLKTVGDVSHMPYDPQLVKNYTEDNGGIVAHLDIARASWRVGQVERKLPSAQQDSSNRAMFWRRRTVEVSKHSTGRVRAIALDGIDQLNNRIRSVE